MNDWKSFWIILMNNFVTSITFWPCRTYFYTVSNRKAIICSETNFKLIKHTILLILMNRAFHLICLLYIDKLIIMFNCDWCEKWLKNLRLYTHLYLFTTLHYVFTSVLFSFEFDQSVTVIILLYISIFIYYL